MSLMISIIRYIVCISQILNAKTIYIVIACQKNTYRNAYHMSEADMTHNIHDICKNYSYSDDNQNDSSVESLNKLFVDDSFAKKLSSTNNLFNDSTDESF